MAKRPAKPVDLPDEGAVPPAPTKLSAAAQIKENARMIAELRSQLAEKDERIEELESHAYGQPVQEWKGPLAVVRDALLEKGRMRSYDIGVLVGAPDKHTELGAAEKKANKVLSDAVKLGQVRRKREGGFKEWIYWLPEDRGRRHSGRKPRSKVDAARTRDDLRDIEDSLRQTPAEA